jgi:F-type H+-transporting ATPase subunit gamma
MATIQSLKRRIKSAKNIKQITKAMEMVAASKMRRAQAQAMASRAYSRKLEQTLATIATLTNPSIHPLLSPKTEGDDFIVMFSTDKSLAGSLNTNLFRGLSNYLAQNLPGPNHPRFVIVGQKARQFVLGNDYTIEADFSGIPDPVSFQAAVPLAHYVVNEFLSGNCRSVTLVYMEFISTLVQKFRATPLLPLSNTWSDRIDSPAGAMELATDAQYMFEPNAPTILNWLLPYYIEMIIYQTLLENRASEHSARMVAMKNASDSAAEIITDLTLSYNKQRQEKITNELLDNATASAVVT